MLKGGGGHITVLLDINEHAVVLRVKVSTWNGLYGVPKKFLTLQWKY